MEIVYGFLGVLIGAAGSIGTVWIQQIYQNRRDRAKLVVEAAIRDQTSADEHARFLAKENPGARIYSQDLGYYIALHAGLIDVVEKPNKIDSPEWVDAYRRAKKLHVAASDYAKESSAQKRN